MNKYIVLCTLAGTLLSCGEDSLRSALLDEVTQNESSNNGTMSTFSGRPIVFYNVEIYSIRKTILERTTKISHLTDTSNGMKSVMKQN